MWMVGIEQGPFGMPDSIRPKGPFGMPDSNRIRADSIRSDKNLILCSIWYDTV